MSGVLTKKPLEVAHQKFSERQNTPQVMYVSRRLFDNYIELMEFEKYCKTLFPWKEKQVRLKRRLLERRTYKKLPLPE